tara:strand:- start:3306 stop:3662 length:357 start_codon:yes stop_codon:yes gene_type:complete
MIVAPVTPTLVPLFTADAPLKVTVPKLANETREPPDSKSSTIHSALYSQSEPREASLLKVWVTDVPVGYVSLVDSDLKSDGPLVTFLTIAVPAVLLVAVTVTVITSPAAMVMPEKSYA